VWHASIAYHGNNGHRVYPTLQAARYEKAVRALRGVGDPMLGQWIEHTDKATHVRRRLSMAESVGFTLRDIRGTPEAERLLDVVRRWLPIGWTE
jgi:hypothetical protein